CHVGVACSVNRQIGPYVKAGSSEVGRIDERTPYRIELQYEPFCAENRRSARSTSRAGVSGVNGLESTRRHREISRFSAARYEGVATSINGNGSRSVSQRSPDKRGIDCSSVR